ncbi:hypothetical protein [Rhizobium leguminosarum]|uniref:hypothetical protein n=1 Tax=Rhizobium leguminosarum TaxID=384 RepID=UPI001C96F84D|nr:hypothetical protein [Rhizobium leguminosarum]MBY5462049.1 hypothetical protein [Rhizobium leguminosarum]
MSTDDTFQRIPLVDLEFRFNLNPRFWHGGDEEWSREISQRAGNWLYSMPHVIGSLPFKDELFACLWRDNDRSHGDIVRMIIATEAYLDAHRHERDGASAVTLGFGSGKSTYDVADELKTDQKVADLQKVLEIVLSQGRLRGV